MPSDRKIAPTTMRISTTAAGAVVLSRRGRTLSWLSADVVIVALPSTRSVPIGIPAPGAASHSGTTGPPPLASAPGRVRC
ncbi:hypothetical protein GCM10025787_15050 [Saccharopolyspora rosea]